MTEALSFRAPKYEVDRPCRDEARQADRYTAPKGQVRYLRPAQHPFEPQSGALLLARGHREEPRASKSLERGLSTPSAGRCLYPFPHWRAPQSAAEGSQVFLLRLLRCRCPSAPSVRMGEVPRRARRARQSRSQADRTLRSKYKSRSRGLPPLFARLEHPVAGDRETRLRGDIHLP